MDTLSRSPLRNNQRLLAAHKPLLAYDETCDFTAWQESARKKLMKLLGLPFVSCADDFRVEKEEERDGYLDKRCTFQSEKGYYVPCHVLLPEKHNGKLPLVVCLQGHSTGMHISLGISKYEEDDYEIIFGGQRDFALQAIKQGYAALVIEQRNFGECGGAAEGRPNCYQSTMAGLLMGRTTIGERVWDVSRGLDIIEKYFTEIDMNRIICLGNSGGGTTTFYASCIETRISYSVPSCAFCSFDESIVPIQHCTCNYVPSIRKYFDMGDMAGLIAPRYFIPVCGRYDTIFPLAGVEASYKTACNLYRAAGVPERCQLVIGEGGHRFYSEPTWSIVRRFMAE